MGEGSNSIPPVEARPSLISLGNVEVGTATFSRITIQNNTDSALHFRGNTDQCSSDYCVWVDSQPTEPLASGASSQVEIKYTAQAVGPFSVEIVLYCSVESSTEVIGVQISGLGTPSAIDSSDGEQLE